VPVVLTLYLRDSNDTYTVIRKLHRLFSPSPPPDLPASLAGLYFCSVNITLTYAPMTSPAPVGPIQARWVVGG
jgi:hypothetical protein